MAGRWWISVWFMLTAPLMLWDAGYCLMRPRSMVGGDLHWIWPVYDFYGKVDHVYGIKAFEDGEGFANAAAVLNVIENIFAILYLWCTHIYPSQLASLAGYTGSSMTLAKTILYVSQEYFCGFCATGHNTLSGRILYWILPNIAWLTASILIMYTLGGDILHGLDVVSQISTSTSTTTSPSHLTHTSAAAATTTTTTTMNSLTPAGANSKESSVNGRRGSLKCD